jgi:hypothetical protein
MHNREELDRLLDSALGTYGDPGPGSGLEGRILRRMAADGAEKPRRRWLWWAIALPAAACLLLLMVLSGLRHLHTSPVSTQAGTLRQPSGPALGEAAENGGTPGRSWREGRAGAKARHPMDGVNGPTEVVPCYEGSPSARVAAPCESAGLLAQRLARGDASLHKPGSRHGILAAGPARLPKQDIFPTPQPLSPQEQALALYAARKPHALPQVLGTPQQYVFRLSVASIYTLSVRPIPLISVASIPTPSFEPPDAIQLGPPSEDEN